MKKGVNVMMGQKTCYKPFHTQRFAVLYTLNNQIYRSSVGNKLINFLFFAGLVTVASCGPQLSGESSLASKKDSQEALPLEGSLSTVDQTQTGGRSGASSISQTSLTSITELENQNEAIFREIVAWGSPEIQQVKFQGQDSNYSISYPYFIGSFNCQTKSALWNEHVINVNSASQLNNSLTPVDYWNRFSFRNDPNLPLTCRSLVSDYTGSGFDRGHLAPANDFVNFGDDAIEKSYYTSNVAPQVGVGFNRHLWYNLERAVRNWAESKGPLVVYAGPVYLQSMTHGAKIPYLPGVEVPQPNTEFIGWSNIRVPDYFYKIIVSLDDPNEPHVLAFLMRNIDHRLVDYPDSQIKKACQDGVKSVFNPQGKICERDNLTNIERHQTTIDKIEKVTGLVFFPHMKKSQAKLLKSSHEPVWPHEAFSPESSGSQAQ